MEIEKVLRASGELEGASIIGGIGGLDKEIISGRV
jgi:hypothetical protein